LTVRKIYEKDRQPETLQEASGYLQRMTEGRYARVWTPLGEDTLLVEDQQGISRPVEQLSRGTREQLFLSLRLALANCYARRGVQMPIILDDVLVNFDGRRAKAAATVLRDFAAAGHQVLVFTCHEHIMKLFQSLRVPVINLPDREEPAAAVIEAPKAEPPKRKRKAKPQPEPEPVPQETVAKPRRRKSPPPEPEPELVPVEELAPWEEADEDLPERFPAEDEPQEEALADEEDADESYEAMYDDSAEEDEDEDEDDEADRYDWDEPEENDSEYEEGEYEYEEEDYDDAEAA
jgi:hypothetical protein